MFSLIATVVSLIAPGNAQNTIPIDLGKANLEDLMNIKVTSVSKREQKLSQTAAAIFVITQEDIRRSGATNIPDLLRMAPGVDVAQINANTWAIGVRGFSSSISNKVLVLIDGRTVYTPLFSGVEWDAIDMPLEDIERIEIIRGPGATVWGANAVNGVISILTKHSRDTKGGLATAGGGTQVNTSDTLQFGGDAGNAGTYRAFVKGSRIGNSGGAHGGSATDMFRRARTGFRSDWAPSRNDTFMVQGGFLGVNEVQTRETDQVAYSGQLVREAVNNYSTDLMGQWNHTLKGGSETSLMAYYNGIRRTDYGAPGSVQTVDVDFQQHALVGKRHEVVWGFGYRSDHMRIGSGDGITLLPVSKTTNLFSAFIQDEFQISNSVWLTLGTKLEHNSYTGIEVEPSVRLAWSPPSGKHTVWAAAAKSLRQPALLDTELQVNLLTTPAENVTTFIRLKGSPRVKDEELRDYELGYRAALTKTLSLDVSGFLSFYHHLESGSIAPQNTYFIPGSPLQVIVPYEVANQAHARNYGGEASLTWTATPRWRMSTSYSHLRAKITVDPNSGATPSAIVAKDFPRNMVDVRSFLNLGHKVEFDQSLYYTARLPGGVISGHARLDCRLARKLGNSTEVSITGQNLLRNRTTEYGDSSGVEGAQSLRSVYASMAWRFGRKTGE